MPPGNPPVTKILLFDVDGTLVLTGGAGLRAMTRALEEVFGVRGGMCDVPVAGRTDRWILSQVALKHGFSHDADSLQRFHDTYVAHLAREILLPGPRKGMMPGVRRLLDTLALRDDAYLALLTGNFERGARIKLEYFDLWRYFACGAFGDDALERNGLLTKALSAVRACGGPEAQPSDIAVIGDTPLDVAVAAAGGVRSIAVATGSHDVAALRESGADVVLPDFSDVKVVLDAMGLR
jgi:phosphoglycolate phosphatase